MMRVLTLAAAAILLAGCQKTETAEPAANNAGMANDMMANDAAATPAAFSINETTWEFIDPKTKKPLKESVDAAGTYITWAGTDEHIDHGTAVMKDGKACFTSAMNKDGEMCWTDPKLDVGASGETVSDKGDKLAIKRVAYVVAPPIPS